MNRQGSLPEREKDIKRGLMLGLALLVALASACSRGKEAKENTAAAATPGKSEAASPTPNASVDGTTTAAISRGLPRTVDVVGSLAADEEVIVSAQAVGELAQLSVDFGSYVKQGQMIAQIDQRDARLRVEQAEATLKQTLARLGVTEGERVNPQQTADVKVAKASLDQAKIDLDRTTKLIENGDIARSAYDQSQTNYNLAQARYQAALDAVNQQLAVVEQQRAALNLARKAISDTVVRAPISGAVKEKFAARGSFLAVGGRIVSLVRINPLRLRAEIPEYAAAMVRIGQTMKLTVDALADRTFTGRVVRIGPSLNEQTRALTVEAEVNNAGGQLRPGMFAKSQLITAPNAPAIMIPQRAITTAAGLSKVFVITDGKAEERVVKTGATDGELIEVTEGIREGEMVATSNLDKLQTGAEVRRQ